MVGAAGLTPAHAQELRCLPCAAIHTADPTALAASLDLDTTAESPPQLLVKWNAELADPTATAAAAAAVGERGALPVVSLETRAPAPILDHVAPLEVDLENFAAVARRLGDETILQIVWSPESGEWTPDGYGFLIKRAAVTITGAAPEARILTAPLPADEASLRSLWAEDISAYIDLIALAPAPADEIGAAIRVLGTLDPGRQIFVDAVDAAADSSAALLPSTQAAGAGAAGAFVRLTSPANSDALATLVLLAHELSGDVSLDPFVVPTGARSAWTFVRGDDLSLRVIFEPRDGETTLEFPDRFLARPVLAGTRGEGRTLPMRRREEGLHVTVRDAPAVALLRLDRLTATEIEGLEGLEDEVTIADARQMSVEEILSRLQAFEDDQSRRVSHYSATNTSHLRFQLQTATTVETTFRGPIFFERNSGYDWAWQEFLVNGIRWRGKRIPRIPLIQPERAAAQPLEIHFTREYRYRLRGTKRIRGRDCWVVEFKPAAAVENRSLYQGTVWIDREIFARVRTRAVQVGLKGDVISNEETLDYSPLHADGSDGEWSRNSVFLPTRTVGQQLWSLFNSTTLVETESELSSIVINGADFEDRRDAVRTSDSTMVRDTEAGLRYLVTDDSGERVVQDKLKPGRLFLAGGVFWDDSVDFPLPLAGADYFNLDFKGTGAQVNSFFTVGLIQASIADPSFLGSRWDIGADAFAIAFSGTDETFRNGIELPSEEIESRPAEIEFELGRPLGAFFKFGLEYGLESRNYDRTSSTAEDFAVPSDTTTQSLGLALSYSRAGYRLRLRGANHRRSDWDPWGFAGNTDYDTRHKTYSRWDASFAKSWHLQNFKRFGLEMQYLDGSDLDRFSKYEFGFFSDVSVHGYQNNKVRAQSASAIHLSYGLEIGEVFRITGVGDAAWASDPATGLRDELLAGVGVAGTVTGPWQTLIRLDAGVAVAGPDDGVSLFLAVLKLFG
ncbi:MAG: hypothetical protein VYE73_14150 [Acidobacteriota bacterium]|nr:hypothetical protein [Acidobacteriota bacterium]